MCKEEYDRLMETSPVIPDDIVKQFTIAFGQDKYTEIVRPEICDALISTRTSRNPWYTEENQKKQQTKAFKDTLTKNAEQKRIHQHNTKTITDFQRSFFDLNNREPMNEEIFDNLQETMDTETIKQILIEIAEARRREAASPIQLESVTGDDNV